MSAKRPVQRFEPRAPSVAVMGFAPLVMLFGVMVSIVLPGRFGAALPPWTGFIIIALGLLGLLLQGIRITRLSRQIAASDGFICLNCHYDLHGLPDDGDCPECGESYQRVRLERLWNSWLQDQTKYRKTIRPRLDEPPRVELPRARGPTLIVLTVVPVVLLGPITLGVVQLAIDGAAPWWIGTPLWVGVPVLAVWNARRVLRFQQRLKDADALVCLRCRVGVDPLTDATVKCPRCGSTFDREALARSWRAYLNLGQ